MYIYVTTPVFFTIGKQVRELNNYPPSMRKINSKNYKTVTKNVLFFTKHTIPITSTWYVELKFPVLNKR